jgi:hypothetical protein
VFTPLTSRHFTDWVDPRSGVRSRVLATRLAPWQLSFYFTHDGADASGRWWWFYTAHPPSGSANAGRTLGRLDLADDSLLWFPETQFSDASPYVDPTDGWIYWISGLELWRRGPLPDQPAELVNAFPANLAAGRAPHRVATHLSPTADGQHFVIDALFGNESVIGLLPRNGAPFQPWACLPRCYNHAQAHPTDPELILIAQDWWHDPATGQRHEADHRLWLLRADGQPAPLPVTSPAVAHEWWSADGSAVWFVDYGQGTHRLDLATRLVHRRWPHGICHSHASADESLVVGDIDPYRWTQGVRVTLADLKSHREIDLASFLPPPPLPRSRYHCDPHPRFVLQDQYIVYTTTAVAPAPTLALVHRDDFLAALETGRPIPRPESAPVATHLPQAPTSG